MEGNVADLLLPVAKAPSVEPFRPRPPLVIGLLGGVASGKSAVAEALARRGLVVLDADRESRRVAADPQVLERLAARFGAEILGTDGTLDRGRLAQLVFADPPARADLEAILHPPIRQALLAKLDAALARGDSVVLDAPLLLEGGLIARCDVCVLVAASPATRQARALARGWGAGELERREASQADLGAKAARCAHTIHNDGSLDELEHQVESLLPRLARGRQR